MTSFLHVKNNNKDSVYQHLCSGEGVLEYLSFQAKKMNAQDTWSSNTGENEYCIVLLGGHFEVISNKGRWETKGGRKDVFNGIAHTLYLPRRTKFELLAKKDTDIAIGWVKTDKDFDPVFKSPDQCQIELRGGDNANRQINSLIEPGFPCDKIVCVEVYTPSGNWSSFPAHKHDERIVDNEGNLLEADLEEIYFYKIDKPQGFAIQQVYTADRRIDEIIRVHSNDIVLVPEGYHPVVAGHGYNVYYLNFLAGSDQSLANTADPDHKWLYDTWQGQDERLPMVTAQIYHGR